MNEVVQMEPGAFANLTSLTHLFVVSAVLSSCCPASFTHTLTHTHTLSLSHKIRRILTQNNLTTIPDGYFSDLRSIVDLWLHFNSISVVTPSTFQNMSTLQGL
jgi:hypothetical protein